MIILTPTIWIYRNTIKTIIFSLICVYKFLMKLLQKKIVLCFLVLISFSLFSNAQCDVFAKQKKWKEKLSPYTHNGVYVTQKINQGETIELWFNATEQSKYHQEGESVHLKLPVLGSAPFISNIYSAPIYPTIGENFTIQARIFYLDYINQTDVSNVVIDNVQADLITRTQSYSYYTQSFLLNNSNYNPYNHVNDTYLFIGTASSPYVGKAEIKIKVFYGGQDA